MSDDLPLSGLTVIDFSTLLPGPLAGLMLAEAGARVIKVERPGGEEMRRYPPRFAETSALYALLNAGKEVVEIDLKTTKGVSAARDLVGGADIVVEQFRPGVMDRLGLGYADLSVSNPGLIYCAITGYGQSGPKSAEAGHDLNYIGDTGLLALAPGAPSVPPALIADIGGGTFPAVMNILLALLKRERTGKGAFIDIAMTDAMFTFAWWAYAQGQATGLWAEPGRGMLAGGSPRYDLYPARCGGLIAVAALEDKFWATLCDMLELDEAARDDRADPERTRAAVARALATRTAADWEPGLADADCCVTVVRDLKDAIQHPHFTGRGLFDARIAFPGGETLNALPVPIAPGLRKSGDRSAP